MHHPLTAETRRRHILAADPDSPVARQYPALVKKGRAIMDDRMTLFAGVCRPEMPCITDANANPCLKVTPLIKPVGNACNLRCRYCGTRDESADLTCMDIDLLERLTRDVFSDSAERRDFIFHGGEPLLAGLDFFKAALDFQKRHTREGQVVVNHVQTNGTLVTPEWAGFFADHNFFVGVSLDGPASVHDAGRVGPDGHGTHARVMQAVAYLQEAGAKLQAIAVVPPQPSISGDEMFEFMMSTGIPRWRVNHCRTPEASDTYPRFAAGLLERWMATPVACDIGLFSDFIESLLGYPPRTCWMSGGCRRFIGIDPDGTVSPCCEMPVPATHNYGNLRENSLATILSSAAARRFDTDFAEGKRRCEPCEWHHACNGCSYLRIGSGGSAAAPDPLCRLYQKVFQTLTEHVDHALLFPEINIAT